MAQIINVLLLLLLFQVSGSWDLSELHAQSSYMTGTGEEAGDLVFESECVRKVISTGEEALLNSSPQVPISQEEVNEMGKCPDARKAELDKLKEVGVAYTCTCNSTMTCTMTYMLTLFPNLFFVTSQEELTQYKQVDSYGAELEMSQIALQRVDMVGDMYVCALLSDVIICFTPLL